MVGLFVRLKLRLLAGAFHKDTGRAVGFVVGLVAAVALGGGGGFGLVLLRGHQQQLAAVTVVLYTGLVLGWAIVPLLAYGTDETLDPARLALLPLTRPQLVLGMLAAAAVGAPALATALVLIGGVAALATSAAAGVAAAVAAALEFALCLALSRALATALSRLLRSRRGRDLAVMVGLLVALLAQAINLGSQYLVRHGGGQALGGVGRVLRWLPPGMAAYAPVDARAGAYGLAVGELLAAAAAVVLALAWWGAALARALVSGDESTQAPSGRRHAGRIRTAQLLPGGRTGAVALRSLRYAWRDPRRKSAWFSAIIFGGVAPFIALVEGSAPLRLLVYGASLPALIIGIQTLNQLGIDGTANWMNFAATATAADAREDIAGANLAVAVIGVPVLVLIAVVTAALTGTAGDAAAAFGVALGVLGAGVALGSVVSVLAPYPVPDRGANTFGGAGAGRGCLAGLVTLGATIGTLVLAAPLGALAGGLTIGWPGGRWLLLLLGPMYGALLSFAGRRIAARLLVDRMPEILAQVTLERAG